MESETASRSPLSVNLPESWSVREVGSLCLKIGTGATPRGGQKVYLPRRANLGHISPHCFADVGYSINVRYFQRQETIGSMLDEPEYIKVIEDLGGLVVTDSLCLGTRYFWDTIDETKNPIDAIAERYLLKVSCPRMTDGQPKRAEFMLDMIKQFNVDGVIFQRMKFCAIWWAEVFMLRGKLKEEGIPFLELEREYVLSGAGAMKTRVQTFMEILETR